MRRNASKVRQHSCALRFLHGGNTHTGFCKEMPARADAQMAHPHPKRRITKRGTEDRRAFSSYEEMTTTKETKMQIHRPQSLLILGVVVLMATLVVGVQLNPTTASRESGETIKQPVHEVPGQHFDTSPESFAPTVKKVAPAVVRIVTALRSDSHADLAGGVENPLSRYLLGQVPRAGAGRLVECGSGPGSL